VRTRAQVDVEARISEAEALWYDTSRWPTFIDGFHHVARVDDTWPAAGSMTWDSHPGGRGRVVEVVRAYEARVGQTAAIEDPQVSGVQKISFAALDTGKTRIALELEWHLKEKQLYGPLRWAVDLVFIRPRQREALARTLLRFKRELAVQLEPDRLVNQ
jgi:hypothetical protein